MAELRDLPDVTALVTGLRPGWDAPSPWETRERGARKVIIQLQPARVDRMPRATVLRLPGAGRPGTG